MKFIGILFLINAALVAGYIIFATSLDLKRGMALIGILLFIGALFLLGDRINSVKLLGLGEIRAATDKAVADANAIGELRQEMETQKHTIDLVVREAGNSAKTIQGVEELAKASKDQIAALSSTLLEAEQTLASLENAQRIYALVTNANNDDIKSFRALVEIAKDVSSPYQRLATDTIDQILINTDIRSNVYVAPRYPWKLLNRNISSATLSDFKNVSDTCNMKYKQGLLVEAWSNSSFSMKEKLSFVAYVMNTTTSIRALQQACILMNNEAKLNLNMMGTSDYLKWWRENQHKY